MQHRPDTAVLCASLAASDPVGRSGVFRFGGFAARRGARRRSEVRFIGSSVSCRRHERLGFAPSMPGPPVRIAAPPHSPAVLATSPSSVNESNETYLTVAEVAELLKLNQQTVRNWIDRGELPAVRVGSRRVRIRQSDLDEALATSSGQPSEEELRQQVGAAIAEVQSALAADPPDEAAAALDRLARLSRSLARVLR